MRSLLANLKHLIADARTDENPLDSIPDFASFDYRLAVAQAEKEPIGWSKLKECERRLALYSWVESRNDASKAQHRVFLDDCLSALLLSYEATLQHVKEAFGNSLAQRDFRSWLLSRPEYDTLVKGLRTLRNIEAHVRCVPIQSSIVAVLGGSLPNGRSAAEVSRTWRLPTLAQADLGALRSQPLSSRDLQKWNALVGSKSAQQILTEGLLQLCALVVAAGREFSAEQDRKHQ